MNKYLIMLTFCAVIQRTYSKSLFDYHINPTYDLVAQESASYSKFWPSSEVAGSPPHQRYKHQARGRGYGNGHGKRKHQLSPYAFDRSDSSEEYSGEIYHSPHFHHPHGIPPGQAKKHGHPYGHPHGHSHGHSQGHSHVIPPRFPPPPVYDKNFMNPWTLSETAPEPFIVQLPPLTTPQPFIVQQPQIITPSVYVSPTITTVAPPSSTEADDQLMYDIDVRFGGD